MQDRSLGSARGLAAGIAAIIVAWAVATTAFELVRLHVAAPRAQLGMEMALAAIGLFSAVVLLRIVAEGAGERQLRWVTAGFLMVGPGTGVFAYLLQLVGGDTNLNTSLYTSLVELTVANTHFILELLPASPPHFTRQSFVIGVATFSFLGAAVIAGADRVLTLVRVGESKIGPRGNPAWDGPTRWHWLLFTIPFALAPAAAIGAVVHHAHREEVRIRPMVAMIISAGAHLHQFLWSTTYHPILTSTDLRRGFEKFGRGPTGWGNNRPVSDLASTSLVESSGCMAAN